MSLPLPPFSTTRRGALALALGLGAGAHAQLLPKLPLPPQPPQPRLVVNGGAEPLQIARLSVQAEAVGLEMQTQLELTLLNPNARVLEATLEFPLAPGQVVSGFALDVGGTLVPAVPVPKDRGRQVFEDVTRARVDPALLESTGGNSFKLRVYPLPAGGTRRVLLQLGEALPPDSHGRVNWRLPLDFGQPLASFSARVRLPEQGSPQAGGALRGAALLQQGKDRSLLLEQSAWRPLEPLALSWSPGGGDVVNLGLHEGRPYFLASLPVDGASTAQALPADITLVWDASGSGALRDHAREFALLDTLFASTRQARVRLLLARDTAGPGGNFDVRQGDWAALRQALQRVAYDGASNAAAWVPAAPDAPAGSLVLLFSDGLANWDGAERADRPATPGGATLHAVQAATRHDAARLRALAEARGGRYVDLLATDTRSAAAAILRQGLRLVDLAGEGASGLVAASVHPEGGRITVAGRLDAASARVTLTLADSQGRRSRRTLDLQAPSGAPAATPAATSAQALVPLAAQRWAQLSIAQLEGQRQLHRAQIRRLGEQFRLPTAETSLIVLEALQDYLRFNIEPPAGPLQQAYRQALAERAQLKRRQEGTHLDGLAARLEARKRWWARSFPKDTPPAAPMLRKEAERSRAEGADLQALATAPATPAAPAPALAPRPSRASMADRAADSMAANQAAAPAGKAGSGEAAGPAARIALRPFQPDAAYARRLRDATDEQRYAVYLDERPGQLNSTAFFMDAAEVFFAKGQAALAVRVLSNLAEMELENRHILRILAYRLSQAGLHALAVPLLERVRELAPDEPQSSRDLGLALAAAGQPQRALDLLWDVARQPWDTRFADIDLIALGELNALRARHPRLDSAAVDPRLLHNLPLDLRAVLSWDADNTDIDLWVTDPNGERAYYGHRLTYQGGAMSRDFTGGYGPEEFSLRTAKPGRYEVRAQFYGHRQQLISPYTTLMLWLSTGFGTAAQKDEHVVLRLQGAGQEVLVGSFEVGGTP